MIGRITCCFSALAIAALAACGDAERAEPRPTSQPSATPTATGIAIAPIPLGTPGARNPSHLAPLDESLRFERGTLELGDFTLHEPTTLAFGPDGRLYIGQLNGRIVALTLEGQAVTEAREIAAADALGDVLGLAFDPNDPADPITLYVSSTNVFAGLDAPPFPGKVSKLQAPDYDPVDMITGLPVAAREHATNGIVFDDEGRLYIAQGGTTNSGFAGPESPRPESPLSGAVLVADLQDPQFDGEIRYDPPGEASSTVSQVGGDVRVYASGFRNPYDLVLHSNGKLYATDNGPNQGDRSVTCITEAPPVPAPDELNLVLEDHYYGHPNRNRGRFDERQCSYRSPEDGSGESTPPIASLGYFTSANGMAEYTSGALGGRLRGNLIYVEWAKEGIWRVVLSDDGAAVESISRLVPGRLRRPLDVVVGSDGVIYVVEMGADRITYLTPAN